MLEGNFSFGGHEDFFFCLFSPHRDEASSSWVALCHIQLPAASFAGLVQAPSRTFAPSLWFFTLSLPCGGVLLAGSRSGGEPRGRRYRCAGACSRNFWPARAKAACSPPGQRPNGMAGRLPALALIAASLRFEVTRSFQSFISTPNRACGGAGPARPHRPSLPGPSLPGEPLLLCSEPGQRQSIPAEQGQGTRQPLGGHLHPSVHLFCSSRCHSGEQEHPRGKKHSPRPACSVRRHSPLQNNLELPSFPAKALGRVL